MAEEIHVADVGTSFRAAIKDEDGAVLDLSTSTSLLMWFRRPDLTTFEKEASLFTDGTDGVIEYVIADGDLDQAGKWKAQGVVGFPGGGLNHSDIHSFKVFANLM